MYTLVKPVHSLVPAKPRAQTAPSKQFVSVDCLPQNEKVCFSGYNLWCFAMFRET
jgi:hypothetical protein